MIFDKVARNTTDVRIRFLAYLAKVLGIQFKIDGIPYGALPKIGKPWTAVDRS